MQSVVSADSKTGCNDDEFTAYLPQVNTYNDYYSFGSLMASRSNATQDYRFGFNGQERDDDIAGTGNINTAEYWEYDTRIGRRWNIDPEISKYPHLSSYACFNGNPITMTDILGNEAKVYVYYTNDSLKERLEIQDNDTIKVQKYYYTKIKFN